MFITKKIYNPLYDLVDFFDSDLGSYSRLFNTMREGSIAIAGDNIPKLNVSFDDENKKLTIKAILAGLNKKDVKVYIKKNCLYIEHTTDKESNKNDVFREISLSSFKRRVAIPDNVDIDSVTSKYEDGVLIIEFNTKEEKIKEITF